ncbi:MAG: NTP transferase domain-containing protein [Lentisphaeria bacterium]|nr:NTP transferase domain-containing protein [Lentisphaeria bacterium]
MDSPEHLYAVIMAGGRGERFWPAGRRRRPKQMLRLLGQHTMIEETCQRLFPLIAPERLLVITNRDYVEQIRQLLPIPGENVIGEPEGRNTAPCVALATALIRRRDRNATMILLPADHVIRPAKIFQETLLAAARAAQHDALVTLGITPRDPATGYGYIELGEPVEGDFRRALSFREKPDAETARKFFLSGKYRWNSGIFVWRGDTIAGELERYAPELARRMQNWADGGDYTEDFATCEPVSIDRAVMEKSRKVIVGEAPFYWNDLGSWSSLRSILPADADGNVIRGRVLPLSSADNILINDDEKTLIGVIGIRDAAIIKSGDGILVCALSEEQRVRDLVRRIDDSDFV